MKIAHVVDSMEVGGVETLVAQMCSVQRDLGHEPIVFVIGSLGPLGERMLREGFDVRAPSVGRLPGAVWKFYRILNQLRPDVVHMHNPTPTNFASLAARAARVPCVVSTRHSLAGNPRRRITELKYACSIRFCDWIVGICDATVMNLKEAHPSQSKKMVRVYNGILPIVRVPVERWPAKQGFTLVYVGRLAPVKNLGLLLEGKRPEFPSGMTSGLRTRMLSWVMSRKWELDVGLAVGERCRRSAGLRNRRSSPGRV